MTRARRLGVIAFPLVVLYTLLWLESVQMPFVPQNISRQILPVFPWWLLVAFGSYALWSLGMGLMQFRECHEAYDELLIDIAAAKKDLLARGLDVN